MVKGRVEGRCGEGGEWRVGVVKRKGEGGGWVVKEGVVGGEGGGGECIVGCSAGVMGVLTFLMSRSQSHPFVASN